jgi:hypothetical protein
MKMMISSSSSSSAVHFGSSFSVYFIVSAGATFAFCFAICFDWYFLLSPTLSLSFRLDFVCFRRKVLRGLM